MTRPAIEIQNLTKSCNEALILAALIDGPRHGYQLALFIEDQSAGFFSFNHGTLYPILHKLEKEGLIQGDWSGGDGGRKRKSYRITARGRDHSRSQQAAWDEFLKRFRQLTGGQKR
jgi:PadR family transcriptional regulator PadR